MNGSSPHARDESHRAGPTRRFRRQARIARQLTSFGAIPLLSLVTPILAIPVIVRVYGTESWGAVAVGQSIGALGGIVVALGWPQIGPHAIAAGDEFSRRAEYISSLKSRRALLLLCLPVTALLAMLLTEQEALVAALTAVSFTTTGLTATWYFVGTGDAVGLLLNETVVRVAATLLACLVMLLGGPLAAYPALLLASQAISDALNNKTILSTWRARCWPSWRALAEQGRGQRITTVSTFVGGAYYAGAVSMVAAVAPPAVLAFAAMDRLQKAGINAGSSLPQAITSWVAAPGSPDSRRLRVTQAIAFDMTVAVVLGMTFFLILPTAYEVLFAATDLLSQPIAAWGSVALTFALINRSLRLHGLTLLGQERFAAWLTTGVSAVGVLLTALGAAMYGASGALAGGALTEILLFSGGAAQLARTLTRERLRPAS